MKTMFSTIALALVLSSTAAEADCFPQFGTDGPDTLIAAPGCDAILVGLGGDDILIGGDGDDVLWGDACGADTTGGQCSPGSDTLTGGGGYNAFGFNRINESRSAHIDTITDFAQGRDYIAMAGICFHANVSCAFIGTNAFSGTPGEVSYRISYPPFRHHPHDTMPVTIVMADMDGDGQPDFQVKLTGAISLTADDFMFTGYPPSDFGAWARTHKRKN